MKKNNTIAAAAAMLIMLGTASCGDTQTTTSENNNSSEENNTSAVQTTSAAETEAPKETTTVETSVAEEQPEESLAEADTSYSYENSYTKKFTDIVLNRDFRSETVQTDPRGFSGDSVQRLNVNGDDVYCGWLYNPDENESKMTNEMYSIGDRVITLSWISYDYNDTVGEVDFYINIEDDRILRGLYIEDFENWEFSADIDEEGRPVETFASDTLTYEFTFDPDTGYPQSVQSNYFNAEYTLFEEGCGEIVFDGVYPESPNGVRPAPETGVIFLP